MIAPSAPSLVDGFNNEYFYKCMINADHAIIDSTLLAFLWSFQKLRLVPKVSGLRYLKILISKYLIRNLEKTFWIMPNKEAAEKLLHYFSKSISKLPESHIYIAPLYPQGEINDNTLLDRIASIQPEHIVIGLGGGTQERVGYLIKTKINERTTIHCIGAAIGFLTGDQVGIPSLIDRLGLGWFIRCLSNPLIYGKRYFKAIKLIVIFVKYRN